VGNILGFVQGYILDKWNLLDFLIYLTFFAVVALHSYSLTLVKQIDFTFPSSSSTGLDCIDCNRFLELAARRSSERSLLAFLFILYWMLALHFVRIVEAIGILLVILEKMLVDLFVFLLVYMVFTVGFAGAFVLTVGNRIPSCSTWGQAIVFSFRITLGDLDFDSFIAAGNNWAFALTILYLLIGFILLLNLLIAMFSTSYSDVIADAKNQYMLEQAEMVNAYSSSESNIMLDRKSKKKKKSKKGQQEEREGGDELGADDVNLENTEQEKSTRDLQLIESARDDLHTSTAGSKNGLAGVVQKQEMSLKDQEFMVNSLNQLLQKRQREVRKRGNT